MPLFDYRCRSCGAVTEVFVHRMEAPAAATCGRCASQDTVRLVSRFTFKPSHKAKYSEEFREKTLPFLKSRPGAADLFGEGGESDEAKAFALTEQIGQRVDTALDSQVFDKLG
jgi:putative FmdB family regulatory protein